MHGTYGYNDGEEFRLSNELPQTADGRFPAVERLVETLVGDPDINEDDVDLEDVEDDEEDLDTLVVDDAYDQFVEDGELFAEEVRNQTLPNEPVPPIYEALEEDYSADAESFPYSGRYEPDTFDGERDSLCKGMLFRDKEALQTAVKEWSIRKNREFIVRRGAMNKTIWEVYCSMKEETGCAWRLRGSLQKKKNNLWEIVRLTHNHTCLFSTILEDHPNLTSCLITKAIVHLVANDPSIKISMIVAEITEKYKITIQYNKAWYAKQRAITQIFGDWKESYAKLPRLLLALKQTNPGTVVSILKSAPDPVTNECQLLCLFWAFRPSIQGFHSCRPVMSIDATHLYGKYKGKLLIAMGVDGNSQVFPVAFGLVREESKSNWGWFLKKLRHAIGPRPNLCLISDIHLGIIAAVNDPENGWAPPLATHRFCLRHIHSNFIAKFHNAALKNTVWNIGSEIQKYKFEERMTELEKLHTVAWQWCKEIPKEQWSLAYDDGHRYGCMTTNLVECFNSVLLGVRNLPVCAMVMLIYHRLVRYFVDKRNNWNRMRVMNTHSITDGGVKLCEESREHACHLWVGEPHCRQRGIAFVVSRHGRSHPVDLSLRSCGCGSWHQYKVPCGHAMKVCMSLKIDFKLFVHDLYKLEAYKLIYTPQFYPLLHSAYWPSYDGPTLVPPHGTLQGIGRPISSRFRNEMDERTAVQHKHCSRCCQPGHTIRSCKSATAASTSAASTSAASTSAASTSAQPTNV